MKLLIIIPAYNEAESLKGVIEHLRSTCPQYDYIIVNDGSTDETEELCEKNGYNVINHTINKGLAEAVRTGMKYAIENGYDTALQFDADGQHLPEYIDGMLELMEKTDCDIVIASRFYKEKMPFRMRTLGGKMISAAIHRTADKILTDPTSGMRLISIFAVVSGATVTGPMPVASIIVKTAITASAVQTLPMLFSPPFKGLSCVMLPLPTCFLSSVCWAV